eukprot:TRINITY_DN5071_c0_g1_i1.p1 TRINITY_DN5071_c0_g1~~TRINITY_DN5071_c0_g1_i1.p1  ORF type:complete len:191 (+),score=45.43 TRINITY_DN5071_c0_g1_i1:125-697(+)
MHDGQSLLLRGFVGSTSPFLLPGDAVIKINIEPTAPWATDGPHLHVPLHVSLRTALAGGHLRVPVLGGAPLVLPVPPHLLSLLPDMELCVAYHGLPVFRTPSARGHLILHCVIRFPAQLPPRSGSSSPPSCRPPTATSTLRRTPRRRGGPSRRPAARRARPVISDAAAVGSRREGEHPADRPQLRPVARD